MTCVMMTCVMMACVIMTCVNRQSSFTVRLQLVSLFVQLVIAIHSKIIHSQLVVPSPILVR